MFSTAWQPDPENIKIAREEIILAFKEGRSRETGETLPGYPGNKVPDDDFVLMCSKIAAFLMDKNAVVRQLKKLNDLLTTKPTADKVKILRETLEEELARFGFHPKLGKTFGFISSENFLSTLANGLLLKDAILGGISHGEFTHVIQWLMIAWQQEETAFLGKDVQVVNVFKQLGNEECIYRSPPNEDIEDGFDNRETMWDLIVDRFSTNDFRQPGFLNEFILNSDDDELSLLRTLLEKRQSKRSNSSEKLIEKYNSPNLKFYHKNPEIPSLHEPSSISIKKKTR